MHQHLPLFSGLVYGVPLANKRYPICIPLGGNGRATNDEVSPTSHGENERPEVEGEKSREKKKCFPFRSNYFPWFPLRNNLDEHSRIREKSWQRLSLAFSRLSFFGEGWRKNCEVNFTLFHSLQHVSTWKGNANWDIRGERLESQGKYFHHPR